jgi:hypothetical protein
MFNNIKYHISLMGKKKQPTQEAEVEVKEEKKKEVAPKSKQISKPKEEKKKPEKKPSPAKKVSPSKDDQMQIDTNTH